METKKMNINEHMVSMIIRDYYQKAEGEHAFVVKDLRLINHEPVLNLFVIIKGRESLLTRDKLNTIFKWYSECHGLEFVDFRYIGNVRKVGYFVEEEMPVFEGIQLQYNNKSFEKKLTLN